jgi:hypothetical protein
MRSGRRALRVRAPSFTCISCHLRGYHLPASFVCVLSFFVFLEMLRNRMAGVGIARLDCVYCDKSLSVQRLYDRLDQIQAEKRSVGGQESADMISALQIDDYCASASNTCYC